MSHQIENNMVAYAGKTPWHGLGFQIPDGATGEEMLLVAGLNWLAERRSLCMEGGEEGGPNVLLSSELDDYRAIVHSPIILPRTAIYY
jgi:hypothetical protein